MLSENDLKVLKAISEGGSDPQSIADKLNMKVEAVRASADALAEQGRSPYLADDAQIARLRERYDAINRLLDRHEELRLGIDRTLLDLDVLAATAVQRDSLDDLDDNDGGALSEQIEHLRIDLAALDAARAEVRLL
jgi:hypothetical protein